MTQHQNDRRVDMPMTYRGSVRESAIAKPQLSTIAWLVLGLLLLCTPAVMADSTLTLGAGTSDADQMLALYGATNLRAATTAPLTDSCAGAGHEGIAFTWKAAADSFSKWGGAAGVPLYFRACTLLMKTTATGANENTQGYIRAYALNRVWYQDTATKTNYDTTNNWTTLTARGVGGVSPDIDTAGSEATEVSASVIISPSTFYKFPITGPMQLMDGADTARLRTKGFIIHPGGKFCQTSPAFTCGGYGFDMGGVVFYKHNYTTASSRPQLKIVYTKEVIPPVSEMSGRRRRMGMG